MDARPAKGSRGKLDDCGYEQGKKILHHPLTKHNTFFFFSLPRAIQKRLNSQVSG
jgi:hypothetical protein